MIVFGLNSQMHSFHDRKDTYSCGFVTENEFHFLLVCPLYNRPSVTLQNVMGHIAPFTLRTLLYGGDNLDLLQIREL